MIETVYHVTKSYDKTRPCIAVSGNYHIKNMEIYDVHDYGATAEELACESNGLGFDRLEFIFAVNVFEELGLVSFDEGKLTVYRGVKAELGDSKIYRKVCLLQES